jgi:hypothetical protein
MDRQLSSAAPCAGGTINFMTSSVWRFKWLIGATIVVAAVVIAAGLASTSQIWTGKTTLKIGLAPTTEHILQLAGPPMSVIETPRSTVARISDPIFRARVASHAAFETATAAASRSMVSSSLRAIVLDNDREIWIELSAASAADVQAAFRAVGAEIERAHSEILNRRLPLLQSTIDEAKSRIAAIEKSSERLNERVLSLVADSKNALPPSSIAPIAAASIPAWNDLQDRIQRDANLKELSEPSVLESEIFLQGHRSMGTLRSSLLAGFGMLVAMIILTIVVSPRARSSAE